MSEPRVDKEFVFMGVVVYRECQEGEKVEGCLCPRWMRRISLCMGGWQQWEIGYI